MKRTRQQDMDATVERSGDDRNGENMQLEHEHHHECDASDSEDRTRHSCNKMQIHTLEASVLPIHIGRVQAPTGCSRMLTSFHASSLTISIIQHLLVQLQLTPGPWDEVENIAREAETESTTGKRPDLRTRKLITMVSSLHSVFNCIRRMFSAGSQVQQVLVLFGASVRNPTLAYRIKLSYDPNAICLDKESDTKILMSMSRTVIRHLIQHSSIVIPHKLPPGLRSLSSRLHVLFGLDRHPAITHSSTGADVPRQLNNPIMISAPSNSVASAPIDETDATNMTSHTLVNEENGMDEANDEGVDFKADFQPKLVDRFSYALRKPSPSPSSPSSSPSMTDGELVHTRRQARSSRVHRRPPHPRSIMPVTLLTASTVQEIEILKQRHQTDSIHVEHASCNMARAAATTSSIAVDDDKSDDEKPPADHLPTTLHSSLPDSIQPSILWYQCKASVKLR